MSRRKTLLLAVPILPILACVSGAGSAGDATSAAEPVGHVYASPGGIDLKAYLFAPEDGAGRPRSAVLVFHGGGWSMGSADWSFPKARHYASRGVVGIAVQYRISDEKDVTPLEAMADAREAVRWTRRNASDLGIDPDRIAAFGWSAGAHLAACAAIFDTSSTDTVSCSPDALILSSPAVSLAGDGYVQRLLGSRARAEEISPAAHVRPGMPPTFILQGRTDTVTPLAGTLRFHEAMIKASNTCSLHVFNGVGHLFTPSDEPDDGWPNSDPETSAEANRLADAFLVSLGFMEN